MSEFGFRVVRPDVPYGRCLDDLADCVTEALVRAGYRAYRSREFAGTFGTVDVLLGAHTSACPFPGYPVVIYQTELPSSKWWTVNYLKRLGSARAVWDAVPGLGYELPAGSKRAVLEPGLIETRPTGASKDIDVLFYGSLSERRVNILTKLHDAGIAVESHFNVFGEERNVLIDRARVVVDIKQGDGDPDDTTRTFFLDSRGACVLSENDQDDLRRLRPERIVDQVRELLGNERLQREHAAERRAELKQMDASAAAAALFVTEPIQTVAHHPV